MRTELTRSLATIAALGLTATLGCSSSNGSSPVASTLPSTSESSDGSTAATTTATLAAMYAAFAGVNAVYASGSDVIIETDNLPEHQSPYYGVGHALYVAPHAGMVVNPNRISTQDIVMRIPASPQVASASDTPLGAIGVAVNGVVLFNQYAGRTATGWLPLDNEIATFDTYNGHPQGSGQYHYHVDPLAITGGEPSALVGVLLDGFPVYGMRDQDGSLPSDLDQCNGHVGATTEFPAGIYHYHVTAAFPYISGCFRGVAGTVTN